jgi:hypothetical protein
LTKLPKAQNLTLQLHGKNLKRNEAVQIKIPVQTKAQVHIKNLKRRRNPRNGNRNAANMKKMRMTLMALVLCHLHPVSRKTQKQILLD